MANEPDMRCRVCGVTQALPPWGDDGRTPSFEVCDCCGTEFGYEDSTAASTRNARSAWITKGAPWFDVKARPEGWDLEAQLQHVPDAFR